MKKRSSRFLVLALGLALSLAFATTAEAGKAPKSGARNSAALRERLRPLIRAAVQRATKKLHDKIKQLRQQILALKGKVPKSAPHIAKEIDKIAAEVDKDAKESVKAAEEAGTKGVATKVAAEAAGEAPPASAGEAPAKEEAKEAPAPAEGGAAAPAPETAPASDAKSGRLRLSFWTDFPIAPLYLSKYRDGYLDDPAKRAAIGKNLAGGKGLVDDISLIKTVALVGDGGAGWDTSYMPGFAKERQRYLRDVISIAHENGMQVLAGYAITDEGFAQGSRGKAFISWLEKSDRAAMRKHAEAVVKFLWDEQKLDFDGVSFDLELNGMRATHAPKMTQFYGELADVLAARGNKIVAIATGIGATKEGGKYVAKEERGLGGARGQPFGLAKGHPNIIVRPMAYDVGIDDPDLRDWHESQIQFALGAAGITPANFQLGIKIIPNVDPKHRSTSTLQDPAQVAARGKDLLRKYKVGLVLFASTGFAVSTSKEVQIDWNKYKVFDQGLNAGMGPAGVAGGPVQSPLPSALGK
jgi:TolA-binding protein